ncbi:MAG: roadblock/LC7 domain-containing protein [Acidimicrobiia bacterium]|nr:roadblock/LC7 domain-containing protein [Acidimicrobiia bacterium]
MEASKEAVSKEAQDFNWLLKQFVERTDGVREAVAVSSDGLLLAASAGRQRENVEQFAAITSGLISLTAGAAACYDFKAVEQVIVEMTEGYQFVTAIGDGSTLGVIADRDCDIGQVAYEMTHLCKRAGAALTPALIAELKNPLSVA